VIQHDDRPTSDCGKAPILLVDDQDANLIALEALLASPDYDLVSVRSGREALAQLEQKDFALVLLDVQMPSMDGLETALRMQKLAERRHVPILLVTAIDAGIPRMLKAYASGAADVLQKPIEPAIVRSKVFLFVELYRARQRLAAERLETRRRLDASEARLKSLSELAIGLSQAQTRDQVGAVVVEHGMRAAGADTATVYMLDAGGTTLQLIADRGVAPEIVDKIRSITETSGNPQALETLRTGSSVWAESEAQYIAIYPALATAKAEGRRAKAFWSVPLIVENRPVGLLGMGFYEPRKFSAEERSFVETFAKQCAQALLRASRLERETEARGYLLTTLRSIGDALIATDPLGSVTFMNPVAVRLTGWTEEEARGRPLDDVFPIFSEKTRKKAESPVSKVLREGTVVGLANHTVLRSRKGIEIPIDDSGAPIRDEAGRLLGVVMIFRDVTREKRDRVRGEFLARAGEVLGSSLDYRRTLAAVAGFAVPELADWCTIDILEPRAAAPQQLAVAHVDPAKVEYARLLGERYPPDPQAAHGAPQVIRSGRPELYTEIPHALLEAGARDSEHLRMIQQLRLESAMVVPLRGQRRTMGAMTFIYAESGRRYTESDLAFAEDFARRAALAIENAHALKEAEEARARERALRDEAEGASRAKDEFLATVSHELRTPLNAILGWTLTLRRRKRDGEVERALAIIERNARVQTKLIEDVLDVSRIISGKLALSLGPTNMAQTIDASIETVAPAAEAKGIVVRRSIEDRDLTITADADRLHQVVWNLLSNAVKFSPKGGEITVRAYRDGSDVCLLVKDTGEGIRRDVLPLIFEPFHQADRSTTRRHGGLGLGLAIVKQLVSAHGGTVRAESDGEGKGATFVVQLPARSTIPARPARPVVTFDPTMGAESGLPRLDGLRLLVVDDEEDARQLLAEVLREQGAVVDVAASADAALERIDRLRPDVIVSDVGMPGTDGYSFIRRVRALLPAAGGRTPAVALTAYARAEDAQRAFAAGFQMHVTKPIDPARLLTVVANLGGRSLG